MNDCIFCKIVNNEIPSKTIFEDGLLRVFLDVNPSSNGHMLVVPKKHLRDFYELDNDILIHITKITKKMSDLAYNKLNCDGIRLISNHGICQDVKHFHLHIIPIYKEEKKLRALDEILNLLTK